MANYNPPPSPRTVPLRYRIKIDDAASKGCISNKRSTFLREKLNTDLIKKQMNNNNNNKPNQYANKSLLNIPKYKYSTIKYQQNSDVNLVNIANKKTNRSMSKSSEYVRAFDEELNDRNNIDNKYKYDKGLVGYYMQYKGNQSAISKMCTFSSISSFGDVPKWNFINLIAIYDAQTEKLRTYYMNYAEYEYQKSLCDEADNLFISNWRYDDNHWVGTICDKKYAFTVIDAFAIRYELKLGKPYKMKVKGIENKDDYVIYLTPFVLEDAKGDNNIWLCFSNKRPNRKDIEVARSRSHLQWIKLTPSGLVFLVCHDPESSKISYIWTVPGGKPEQSALAKAVRREERKKKKTGLFCAPTFYGEYVSPNK